MSGMAMQAPAAADGCRALPITDAALLAGLRPAWEALEASAGGPIEHFEWTRACVEALSASGRLKMFSIWDGGRCKAIAPLVERERSWWRAGRLESIGVRELTEPMDLVYADRAALARLCDELSRHGSPVDLQRVPADSPVAGEVQRAFRRRGFVRVAPVGPYPYLEIDPTWVEPETHFNAGRRSDFRRALRNAGQSGTTGFEVVTPQPSNLDELLGEAYDAEFNSWKGRNGTALAVDPLRSGFYRRYFAACCAKGILRLAFMRIDGKAVAMQIAIESRQRFWLLKIGHNEAYARSSPGTLLMLHAIRYAAQRGLQTIEFLGSAEPWTRLWTARLRECVRVRAYPFSSAGAFAFGADAARWGAWRLRRTWKRAED
jgi:hypothetical protein